MKDLSALRQHIAAFNKERTEAISRTLDTKPYIAAQIYERYKKCGNTNCKCAKGELHGPFLWIYQKRKGQKAVSTTVAKEKAKEATELAQRYKTLLSLRHQIRQTDQKINTLLNELALQLEKEITVYVKRNKKA